MMHQRRLAALSLLIVFPLASAIAAPKQGVSVHGGFASNSSKGEFTKGDLDGESFSISSSGLALGLDYQWPVAENLSVNLFFQSSFESASSSELDIESANHGVFGVEGRYWFRDYFTGLHLGRYTEVVTGKSGNSTTSTAGSGFGYGLTAGWQQPNGNWFVFGQYDNAGIAYSDASSKLTGMRLNAGYRWGR